MAIEGMLKELKEKKDKLKMGGGKKKLETQHAKGKLSARERLDILLDKGSFTEINGLIKHRQLISALIKQIYLEMALLRVMAQLKVD